MQRGEAVRSRANKRYVVPIGNAAIELAVDYIQETHPQWTLKHSA
jgi:hypothetical protein